MKKAKQILAFVLCLLMLNSNLISTTAFATVSSNDVVDDTTAPIEAEEVCEECGATEGHLESCSQYEVPVEDIAETDGPQVGDIIWIKTGSRIYKEPDVSSDGHTVILFYQAKIVEVISDENGNAAWYKFDSDILSIGYSAYKYVHVDNTTDERPETEDNELKDDANGITVTGNIPAGTELAVETATLADVARLDQSLADMANHYVAYDISMLQGDTEWQPGEGETVNVTLDASDIGETGDDVLVYHVHKNEDGTATTELLGPYTIDASGNVNFDMTGFSYVIVVDSTVEVENISAFYTVTGTSGNKHFNASCVYITQEGNVHLILTADQKQADNCYATEVSIDDTTPISALGKTKNYGKVTKFYIRDAQNTTDVTDIVTQDSRYNYVMDIDLGKNVTLNGSFNISVTWNNGTMNGFKIEGMKVTIVFNQGIEKTVYSVNGNVIDYTKVELGYTPEVKANDEVIYKIQVKNGADSTQAITFDVVDILPASIFDNTKIEYSSDLSNLSNWKSATVTDDLRFTIDSNVTLKRNETKTYYVKTAVLETANTGTYTNAARMVMTNSYKEDAADVKIAIKTGTLRISKVVEKEYEKDILPENDSFTFTLKDSAGAAVANKAYSIGDTSGQTNSNGQFSLQANETAVFKDILAGTYTIVETADKDYSCNWRGNTTTADVIVSQTATVTCTNTYKRHLADLTITKTGWDITDEYQSFIFTVTGPDDFTMNVGINGNSSVTIKDLPLGEYTVTENTAWSWRYAPVGEKSKSITLAAGNENEVTFANRRSWIYWLSGDSYNENQFKVKQKEEDN